MHIITFTTKMIDNGYEVRLLYIYDKSDIENIEDTEIASLMENMKEELENNTEE